MDEKKKVPSVQHKLVLVERESMSIDGVSNVESFDDEEVILETNAGILIVKGKELHIKQLNLDEGNLAVEGYIQAMEYVEEAGAKKAKGLLGRLLR